MGSKETEDYTDGIWDDGEWISWDYINQLEYLKERDAEFPAASQELLDIFDSLVNAAFDYRQLTGRHMAIFGELGELYAEIKYGIKRHRLYAAGSDGKLGDNFVEVKTISPDKQADKVQVKRKGNFNKLIVVKISDFYDIEARMIDRADIHKGKGKFASVRWGAMPSDDQSDT